MHKLDYSLMDEGKTFQEFFPRAYLMALDVTDGTFPFQFGDTTVEIDSFSDVDPLTSMRDVFRSAFPHDIELVERLIVDAEVTYAVELASFTLAVQKGTNR